MGKLAKMFSAVCVSAMLTAGLARADESKQPYALAAFAYAQGRIAQAALIPGGDSAASCEQKAHTVREQAKDNGIVVTTVCFQLPPVPADAASATVPKSLKPDPDSVTL